MRLVPMVLLSCGPAMAPAATCETYCGLRFVGDFGSPEHYPERTGSWSCDVLQVVESGIVARFPGAGDTRFRNVCSVMGAWSVEMLDKPSFHDAQLGELIGLTDCTAHHTTLANLPADRSSLPHEMAHAVQGCIPNSCAHPGVDAAHSCWQENGINSTIDDANLEAWRHMPADWFRKDGGQ